VVGQNRYRLNLKPAPALRKLDFRFRTPVGIKFVNQMNSDLERGAIMEGVTTSTIAIEETPKRVSPRSLLKVTSRDSSNNNRFDLPILFIRPESLDLSTPSKGMPPTAGTSLITTEYVLLTGQGMKCMWKPMNIEDTPSIKLYDVEYSASEVIDALNYGISPLFDRLAARRISRRCMAFGIAPCFEILPINFSRTAAC
jgi:hypothetical protein